MIKFVSLRYRKIYHVMSIRSTAGIVVPCGLGVSVCDEIEMLLPCRASRESSHLNKLIAPYPGIILVSRTRLEKNRLKHVACLYVAEIYLGRICVDFVKILCAAGSKDRNQHSRCHNMYVFDSLFHIRISV